MKRSFENFLIFSNFLRSYVLSLSATGDATRLYQFVTNKIALFYVWWKENLVNYQNFSKTLWIWLFARFSFAFYVFNEALIVRNSHILGRIYLIFLEKVQDQTWRAFITTFVPQWKDCWSSYQVRQVLVLFSKLVALI